MCSIISFLSVSDFQALHLQVINNKNKGYGLPADIWSLGCSVLEMLTSQIPYAPLECVSAIFIKTVAITIIIILMK